MSLLQETTVKYRDALGIQRERLSISEWLHELHKQDHDCPLCGNPFTDNTNKLDALERALRQIEEEAGRFENTPLTFDREFEHVKSEIHTLSERLRGVQMQREALERRSDDARQLQYESLKASRFIGSLEQSLNTYTRIGTDSELDNEVRALRERVKALEQDISENEIERKTKRALHAVNSNAQRLLPDLDVERPHDPISLSIDDLTIKVGGVDREDYLWEMGSGSNWLSYHVAVTLGLQQYFLGLLDNPVPGFIVYDQPSQVYFPKRLATTKDEVDLDPQYQKDEDIMAVRKVFTVLASVTQRSKGALQIIVLDHASENVWGQIEGVSRVEEWRNGTKLVPETWLSSAK